MHLLSPEWIEALHAQGYTPHRLAALREPTRPRLLIVLDPGFHLGREGAWGLGRLLDVLREGAPLDLAPRVRLACRGEAPAPCLDAQGRPWAVEARFDFAAAGLDRGAHRSGLALCRAGGCCAARRRGRRAAALHGRGWRRAGHRPRAAACRCCRACPGCGRWPSAWPKAPPPRRLRARPPAWPCRRSGSRSPTRCWPSRPRPWA